MMVQKIFTKTYAELLQAEVEQNLSKYTDPSFSWEDEAKDSIIEIGFEPAVDLSEMLQYADAATSEMDFEAGKILYMAYKDLTALEAAQKQLWHYLSHVVLYEYMRRRWPKVNSSDCTVAYVKEHWFYGQGLIRNWLEGLFWSFRCSVDEKEDDPYKYTRFLFRDQNIRNRGLAAATFVFSFPEAVKGMCQYCIDELAKKEAGEDSVFDKYFEYRFQAGVIQAINKLGGVVELSTYTKEDFREFLVQNSPYIKSIGDRKKEHKERREKLEAAGLLPKKKKHHKKRKK